MKITVIKNPKDSTLCGCDASTSIHMSYGWCENKATHIAETKGKDTKVMACDKHVAAWQGGYFVNVEKLSK